MAEQLVLDIFPKPKELLCLTCGSEVTRQTMWQHPYGLFTVCVGPFFMRQAQVSDAGEWDVGASHFIVEQRNADQAKNDI